MHIKKIIPISIFMALIMSVGCTQLPQVQDLPIRNPLRSGLRVKLGALPALSNPAHRPQFVKQWSSQLSVLSEGLSLYPKILPAVDSQWIFQANHKGNLVALNRKTGKKQWQLKTPYTISAGPTIIGNNLLMSTHDARVVSLNKYTGAQQWITNISSEALASPKGNENIVIVHTIDGKITGLSPKDGQVLWTYDAAIPTLMLRGSTSPVLVDNFVLCGLANGKLVALHVESGMVAWEKAIASPKGRSDFNRMVDIRADLVMDGGDVLVAAFQGNITKIHLITGQIQWQRDISVYHTMSMDDDALYVTDAKNHVWALDKVTGETLWEQDNLTERYLTAPAIIGNTLLVGDRGGYIHSLDKKTGQLKARYLVGNKIISDLVVDKDAVLVSTQNGKLSVFKIIS